MTRAPLCINTSAVERRNRGMLARRERRRRSPPRRGRPPAASRDDVLEAALAATSAAGASTSRRSPELGLGRTTVYRWFGSREGLVGEAIVVAGEPLVDAARARRRSGREDAPRTPSTASTAASPPRRRFAGSSSRSGRPAHPDLERGDRPPADGRARHRPHRGRGPRREIRAAGRAGDARVRDRPPGGGVPLQRRRRAARRRRPPARGRGRAARRGLCSEPDLARERLGLVELHGERVDPVVPDAGSARSRPTMPASSSGASTRPTGAARGTARPSRRRRARTCGRSRARRGSRTRRRRRSPGSTGSAGCSSTTSRTRRGRRSRRTSAPASRATPPRAARATARPPRRSVWTASSKRFMQIWRNTVAIESSIRPASRLSRRRGSPRARAGA